MPFQTYAILKHKGGLEITFLKTYYIFFLQELKCNEMRKVEE